MTNSKQNLLSRSSLLFTLLTFVFMAGCLTEPTNNSNTSPTATPSPSASPSPTMTGAAVTLPVLDALFTDEAFKAKLKTTAELSDQHIDQLRKLAGDEVARLRELNAEDQNGNAEESRQRAREVVSGVVGAQKAGKLFEIAHNHWVRGGEESSAAKGVDSENGMLSGPNAVPKDTRVVVNIPAYRMDVFNQGTLVKSYKIGIGYPQFPLPTGLRKAQTIIFNPTWTPPDEPWVAKMRGVAAGKQVAAGSKLNPLGPVKIPIGLPSLIHGGKSPAKLGTFASHGCVGLTSPQVQDFSKLLAQVSGKKLTDQQLQSYFKDKTKTQVVKLEQTVPVELRYETIVVEDGKLRIYRDVYDHHTNSEENLRAVLEASGVKLEDLSEAERSEVREALNAMSRYPKKIAAAKPASGSSSEAASEASPKTAEKKEPAPRKKPISRNQKEVVIELAALKGKGYPVAVNLDTGSGKPAATVALARPTSESSAKQP